MSRHRFTDAPALSTARPPAAAPTPDSARQVGVTTAARAAQRVAVIADIHGSREALVAVLADVDAWGAEEIWCLGDIVDFGADPAWCLNAVRTQCDLVVVGNHDLLAAQATDPAPFADIALEASVHSRAALGGTDLEWLAAQPSRIETEDGTCLVHALPQDPVWGYLDGRAAAAAAWAATDAFLILCGHTHTQSGWRLRTDKRPAEREIDVRANTPFVLPGERSILSVGSVGHSQHPRDPRAAYLRLDLAEGRGEFRRVDYDWQAARAAIAAAGLPSSFARGVGGHGRPSTGS